MSARRASDTTRPRAAAALAVLAVVVTSACASSPWLGASSKSAADVVAQVATYRVRGRAATDHVFDVCQDVVAAAPKSGVNPYTLPQCSTEAITARIHEAAASASALTQLVTALPAATVAPATLTRTVAELNALAAALRAWQHCAAVLKSPAYFDGNPCTAEVDRVDATRSAMIRLAQQWPEPA